MDYVEAAAQLGQAIISSDEFTAFKVAEDNLMVDQKAVDLIQEYKDLQYQIVEGSKGDLDKAELEKIRDSLLAKQQELNEYAITKAYFDAKKGFENMMSTVNDIIQNYVAGGGGECSGSCESCGGCH